jgi:glycosyltransferase involved in cell wall biosynthesis
MPSESADCRLVVRRQLPDNLETRYRWIIDQGHIRLVDRFVSAAEMENLFPNADIYVLPSGRLHVSFLRAMAHGLALVFSDGWGIGEYIEDGKSGLVVSGRYGKRSWMAGNGMLREYYKPLLATDENVVDGLVEKLSILINDRHRRRELGEAARNEIDQKFGINIGTGALLKRSMRH